MMRFIVCTLLLLAPGWSASRCRADDETTPRFILHTVDGSTAPGALAALAADWSVTLSGKAAVPGANVVSLRRSDIPLPPPCQEGQIILTNGDRLPAAIARLADDRLHPRVTWAEPRTFSLSLSVVSVIWLGEPAGLADIDGLQRRWLQEQRTADRVLLRNGDQLEGTLIAIESQPDETIPAQLHLEAGGRLRAVERDQVAAIALNTELARPLRAKKTYGRLVLRNGGRLSLASARLQEGQLIGQTLFGITLAIPLVEVAGLDLLQGRAVYLSDLKPTAYQHTPYLGVRWPYAADATVQGQDLRLGGSSFDKGIGLRPRAALTYDVPPGCRFFEALVGLDDRAGRKGSVAIQVLVDGQLQDIGWDKELRWADGPRRVRVPVSNARQLTLKVDFGQWTGSVQGDVNWADARFLR
ncbi:MAG: NPCBM/NEW2 domain-containing protein [Gemmataceae bacterium]